ncbi:unannotated protein [freshwater metagenome]|uniref:Unannotated protein n=1 Tax=freshwater metagenome TaxID=449393 RepID=A0A6J7JG30_9ZZZZ
MLAPAQVVALAHESGVELLALTDHDTVAGVDEALAAAAQLDGIRVLPAIEISALDGIHGDLHICGYGIDHHDAEFLAALGVWRGDRHARAAAMAEGLREAGLELELPEAVSADHPVGRPHLAAAVLAHPANAARLRREGINDPGGVIEAYLVEGAPAFRRRSTPTVARAVDVIHAAGGVAVWAHPFWDLDAIDEACATLERLAALGIDGVEAFYITHGEEPTRAIYAAALDLGLLTTGSADFHGPDNRLFHAFRAFELYGLEPHLGALAAR